MSRKELEHFFHMLDEDDTGLLSFREFLVGLTILNEKKKSTAKANSVVDTAKPRRPIRMTGLRPITSLRLPQKVLVSTQSAAESEKIIVVSNSLMPRSAAMGGNTAKTSVCPMPTESRQTKRIRKARLRSCGVVRRGESPGSGADVFSGAAGSAVLVSSSAGME